MEGAMNYLCSACSQKGRRKIAAAIRKDRYAKWTEELVLVRPIKIGLYEAIAIFTFPNTEDVVILVREIRRQGTVEIKFYESSVTRQKALSLLGMQNN